MKLSEQISNTRRLLFQEYAINDKYMNAFMEMYEKAIEMEIQLAEESNADEKEVDVCECTDFIYSESGKRRWCCNCNKEDIGF